MSKPQQQNEINLADEANRPAFTELQFWQGCPDRRCRRARLCIGGIAGEPACGSVLEGEARACVIGFCAVRQANGSYDDALLGAAEARVRYRTEQEMHELIREVAGYARSIIQDWMRFNFPLSARNPRQAPAAQSDHSSQGRSGS